MDNGLLATDAKSLDALTYDYFKGRIQLRRQISKEILSNTGVWADVAFLHQDRSPDAVGWKPAKITIARFKRVNGIWRKQSHFNVNDARRADRVVCVLSRWRSMMETVGALEPEPELELEQE